jgi:hypothetical protein
VEEKARKPLCVHSTYASQITCVDDVDHAARSKMCQPPMQMHGAPHMQLVGGG